MPVKSLLQLRAQIFPFLLQQFREAAVVFPSPIVGRPSIVGGVTLFSGLFYFGVQYFDYSGPTDTSLYLSPL